MLRDSPELLCAAALVFLLQFGLAHWRKPQQEQEDSAILEDTTDSIAPAQVCLCPCACLCVLLCLCLSVCASLPVLLCLCLWLWLYTYLIS